MQKYIFNDTTYNSLWEVRKAVPQFVFPPEPDSEQLASLGIRVEENPDRQPTPEELAQAELDQKLAEVDHKTALLVAEGFDYEINGETMHFAYGYADQQNFADTANACLMAKAGMPGLPDSVTWNAWRPDGSLARVELGADEFLALYAGGALAHKAACMEAGGREKAEILAAAGEAA